MDDFIGFSQFVKFIGDDTGSGGSPDTANHILTEASEILLTESGDHLITE
jgi:hypothetical protein